MHRARIWQPHQRRIVFLSVNCKHVIYYILKSARRIKSQPGQELKITYQLLDRLYTDIYIQILVHAVKNCQARQYSLYPLPASTLYYYMVIMYIRMLWSVLGWRNNYIIYTHIHHGDLQRPHHPAFAVCGNNRVRWTFTKCVKPTKHTHHTKHPFPAFRVVCVSAPPRLSACVSVYSNRDGVFSMGWPSAGDDRWMKVRGNSRPWWRHLWLGQGLERKTLKR